MKIAIIGATGRVGTRLIDEALRRGHQVTAIARTASKLPARAGLTAKDVDVADQAALVAALAGNDVAFSTVRFLQANADQIVGAVKKAGVPRLLVVGGAGSLNWTFVSPSAIFEPGERTGHFRVGKDTLLVDANGKPWVSMEDYAIGFLDETEKPAHPRQRFTIGY